MSVMTHCYTYPNYGRATSRSVKCPAFAIRPTAVITGCDDRDQQAVLDRV
jgi:hypothetical protein